MLSRAKSQCMSGGKKTALDVALHFLKFRPRSRFEIERKLRQKKYTDLKIKKTIEILKQEKLLDDLEFARLWIRNRNLLSPRGEKLLFLELRKFGVEQEIVQKALKIEDLPETEKAQIVFDKKKKSLAKFSHKDSKQKMIQYLARRGFDWGTISQVLTDKK